MEPCVERFSKKGREFRKKVFEERTEYNLIPILTWEIHVANQLSTYPQC